MKNQNRDIDLPTTDRPQLPAKTIQLHPTTRPISAYQHQTSRCISTTRPTPATLVERPATHHHDSIIPAIDVTHPSWRPHTTATDIYIHVCNSGNKNVTFVVSIISSFCLPSLSLAVTTLTRITHKIYLRSRHAYRLHNTRIHARKHRGIFNRLVLVTHTRTNTGMLNILY